MIMSKNLEGFIYSRQSSLQELYLKLKKIFEGTSKEIGVLPSATPIVDKEQPIHPSSIENTPVTSPPSKFLGATPFVSTNMSGFSSPNLGSEDVSTFIKI